MAVKSVTLDVEAYSILSKEKRKGESFSKVIKRRLKPRNTAANLLKNSSKFCLSENALDEVEKIVEDRKKSIRDIAEM